MSHIKVGLLILLTTFFLIPSGCAIPSDKTPTPLPETTPVTPAPLTDEASDYSIRIRILTTSDWTTFRLVNGAVWGNLAEVLASDEAEIAEFNGEYFQLTQPIEQAENGKLVEIKTEISLIKLDTTESPGVVEFEIERGHIGWTHVQISNLIGDEPIVVGNHWWGGISSSSNNVYTIQVNASDLFDVLPHEISPLVSPADIILCNGDVITMERDNPQVEALAIKGEDILAVGSNAEILALYGPNTQLIDLEGRTLLPGFVDTHAHYFGVYRGGEITLDEAQNLILEGGTTSVGEMGVDQDLLTMLQDLEQTGRLRVRTNAYLAYTNGCGELQGDWYLEYPPVLDTSRMLRIPGVKMFSDGGSCMRAAFSVNLPEWWVLDDPRGDLFFTSQELADLISDAESHGYQVAVHALGDRAIETALDAYEMALDGKPNVYRHRLEHNVFVRPDYIHRYSEIGVVVSGFWLPPDLTWAFDGPSVPLKIMIDQNPDKEMTRWLQPWRSLLDANPWLHACWQSDWLNKPITGIAPIPDLFSMVTRKKLLQDELSNWNVLDWLPPLPENTGSIWEPPDWFAAEAITVEEALRIMTIDAAYALFMEDKVGSLKPGKYADLVILSDNPLTIDPDSIIDIEVLLTMVGGQIGYCTRDYATLCPD